MTAHKKPGDGVLRDAAVHAQPRHLPRSPRRAVSNGAPGIVVATPARSASAEAGYQQGLEEGRAAGLREGLQGAQQRVDDAMRAARQEFEQVAHQRLQEFKTEATSRLAQLERLLAGFESTAGRRITELESDAVALAFGALCKLLGDQAGDAATIAALVRQALAQLRTGTMLAVRMNENDLRVLLADEQGRRLQAAAPQVQWIADAAVTSGGCLVDTTAGSLDARLDTQLAALRKLWAASAHQDGSPA